MPATFVQVHALVINNLTTIVILKACTSCGSHPIIVSFNKDRILPVQLFCTSIRTETKQNTCMRFPFVHAYVFVQ